MADRIIIRDLHVRGIIGINEDERTERQDVMINLELETDTRPAAESDDISDALNYRSVAKRVIELVETSRFFLLERLAEEIARLCLEESRVRRIRVSVEKPSALRFARSVGVVIERSRSEV